MVMVGDIGMLEGLLTGAVLREHTANSRALANTGVIESVSH